MTKSKAETRRSREAFTAAEDAILQRLTAAGYGYNDIAVAVDHTPRQVMARQYYLQHGRSQARMATLGWPIPDPRKINDYGKGFFDENYVMKRPK